MIPLGSTLCSKKCRKTGIVLSFINMFLQVGSIVTIIVLYCISSRYRDPYYYDPCYYDPGLFGGCWFYSQQLRNLLIDGLFFLVVNIIMYTLLIYGLAKGKSSAITVWLTYSVVEITLVQASLLVGTFFLTVNTNPGLGILSLIIQILIAVYMYYHMSVVFSVRHELVTKKNSSNNNNTNVTFNASVAAATSQTMQPVQFGVGAVPQYALFSQPIVMPATSSALNHPNMPSTTLNHTGIPSTVQDQKQLPPAYST